MRLSVTHREEGSPEPRCLAPENCPSELEKASRQASSAEAGFVNRTPQPTTGVEKLGSENSRDELEKRQYGENEGLCREPLRFDNECRLRRLPVVQFTISLVAVGMCTERGTETVLCFVLKCLGCF